MDVKFYRYFLLVRGESIKRFTVSARVTCREICHQDDRRNSYWDKMIARSADFPWFVTNFETTDRGDKSCDFKSIVTLEKTDTEQSSWGKYWEKILWNIFPDMQ